MIKREDFIAEALSWVGTPYRTLQSCKGIGCDCAGFVYGTMKKVGLLPPDYMPPRVSSQWYFHKANDIFVEELHRIGAVNIPVTETRPGDIISFKYGRAQSHLVILLPTLKIVHCLAAAKGVVVTTGVENAGRTPMTWRLPNLDAPAPIEFNGTIY
jgi:cell wall-associated NlpC family hydrolase